MKQGATSNQAMQRVRVGMVGLAAVILLIGLASALFSAANRQQSPTAATSAGEVANMTATNTMSAAEAENEPLAQLGVAPSTAEPSPVEPAPAAPDAVPANPAAGSQAAPDPARVNPAPEGGAR